MNKSNEHFVKLAVAVREVCDDMHSLIQDKTEAEALAKTLREELRIALFDIGQREDEALALVEEAEALCKDSCARQEELERANSELLVSVGDLNNSMLLGELHLGRKLADARDQVCLLTHEYDVLTRHAHTLANQVGSLLELGQCLLDSIDLHEQDYLQMANSKDAEIWRLERRIKSLTEMESSPPTVNLGHIAHDTSPQEPVSSNSEDSGVILHVFRRCAKKE